MGAAHLWSRDRAAGPPVDIGTHMIAPGESVDDWYVVQRILGEGAGSVVYEATDGVIDATVAIKVLRSRDPDLRARFALEGRVLHSLRDPHVPTTYAIGELPDGSPYIVMEQMTQILADRLLCVSLEFDEIFEIARQLLAACTVIHARGIIHRDIKPSNIGMTGSVGGELSVKLFDFGVCRVVDPNDERGTGHDLLIGTPEYMSPEQIRMSDVDARTDLYSVGVVLYECITGRMPFQGESIADVIAAVMHDPVLCPAAIRRDCSPALEHVVLRALSRARDERFRTADEMADALASATRTLSGTYLASDGVFTSPAAAHAAVKPATVHPLVRKKVQSKVAVGA